MTTRRIAILGATLALLGALGARPALALDVDEAIAALRSLRASYTRSPEALPTGFDFVLSAWQTTPRRLVLAGGRTPDEEDPYVLTHPIFRFRWPGGGVLLVDAGLSPGEARGFARATEWLGADPIVCGRDAFAAIDPAKVGATVFTHLHVDHVDGLRVLCEGGTQIPVRVSPEQRSSGERFEAGGRGALDELAASGCVREEPFAMRVAKQTAPGLVGFPGVHRLAVPGHTPGSQLIVGFVRNDAAPIRAVVVAGDVVNHRAGIRHDRPKPWWYRKLLVREDDDLQARNRALLSRLQEEGFEIHVNHHVAVPDDAPAGECP